MGDDLRAHTLSEEMSEYKASLGRAATGSKKCNILDESSVEVESLFQVHLQQVWLTSFPSHFLCQGTGEGSTGGGILCPTEPGATKLGGRGRSLSRADIQGKSEEYQSLISTHRAGHSSVPLGTDIQGHGRSACGGGFVSALGWWRQPYLPCAAHTGLWPRDQFGKSFKSQLGKIYALRIWHCC